MMPDKFGRYQIVEELGRGGMATVYHAFDPSFQRNVALKVLPREFLHDTRFYARFEREAKAIAMLEHPSIVPVYDFGQENGQPYFVMRYMVGGTLEDRLDAGPLPVETCYEVIRRLGPGLDKAHEKEIIHRDLKPANILFDEDDLAYLSDFGIVKIAQSTAQITGTGTAIGTPAYMSPEQAKGDQPVEWRSDIYSLGVIIYEMLTGGIPYEADTPVQQLMKHVLDPIPRILDINPDLPPACDAIIIRSMAKNPAQRYESVAELVADFERLLRGKEVGYLRSTVEISPEDNTRLSVGTEPVISGKHQGVEKTSFPLKPVLVTSAFFLVAILVGILIWQGFIGRSKSNEPDVMGTESVLEPVDKAPTEAALIPTEPAAVASPTEATVEVQTTPTLLPTATNPVGFAGNPVSRNAEWTSVIQSFAGVDMALVPAGCFLMGSYDGKTDEQPVHEQCFEEPFWIDVTEVPNKQYGFVGAFGGDDRPREVINWFDAVAHCKARGGRLPSEAEWEYAARGPDNRVYPWGNTFSGLFVNYCDESCENEWADVGVNDRYTYTAPVGSLRGVSWVGALDMAGNVWEWTASIYGPYPFNAADGRMADENTDRDSPRVVRGGSWYNDRDFMIVSRRFSAHPKEADNTTGFRCAKDFIPEELSD